jgi:hypothetical protein
VYCVCVVVDDFNAQLSLPLLGLGLQLSDAGLGVHQLAFEPPDHVVQRVEPWGSRQLASGCGNPITLSTTHLVAPPQVFPAPGKVVQVGLGPSVGTSPEPSRGCYFLLATGSQENLPACS